MLTVKTVQAGPSPLQQPVLTNKMSQQSSRITLARFLSGVGEGKGKSELGLSCGIADNRGERTSEGK